MTVDPDFLADLHSQPKRPWLTRLEAGEGRRLTVTVGHARSFRQAGNGWLIDFSGDRFIEAHATHEWKAARVKGVVYKSRDACAFTCWTILHDVLLLPSAF